MSDTQDWSLASAEKAAILSCMAAHPEASKIELAKLLGISTTCLTKKQKEYGVYEKDKRGRPKVKVEPTPLVERADLIEGFVGTNDHAGHIGHEGTDASLGQVTTTEVPQFQEPNTIA